MLTMLDRLKGLLGAETWGDEMLTLQIASASAAIENYCRRSFKKQSYTERVNGYATSRYINLRNYPIHRVTQIAIKSEYDIFDDGRLYCAAGWPAGERNIEVSYIGGYVLPGDATADEPRTLPEPLELACLLLIQMMLRDPAVRSERVGNINVTYADFDADGRLPGPVAALVAPYVGRWV